MPEINRIETPTLPSVAAPNGQVVSGTPIALAGKQFTHQIADVNGVRLHYVQGGSGMPIVLLHGYPETWYAWRKVMPALSDRYSVIAPDLRGLGDSSHSAQGYDKKTVAEDIHQLVKQLDLGQIVLVSADMGGPVAYAYAALYPKEVSHFVYLESGIPGLGLERLMDVTQGGSWHFGFFMAQNYPEMLTAGREREFLTAFAYQGSSYIKDAIGEADIDEYMRHYAAPGGMKAGFEYYRAFPQDAQDNQELSKTKLTMPVLAIDAEYGFGGNIATMEKLATNVQGVTVPDSGHWIAEEQPQYLVSQILEFLIEK